jgi:hypothetical protein
MVIMIDALIRGTLGTVGTHLLDFYVQNSLWINALLFVYAILVIFARRNYGQVARHILADFHRKHGDKLDRKEPQRDPKPSLEMEYPMGEWNAGWLVSIHLISSRYFIAI